MISLAKNAAGSLIKSIYNQKSSHDPPFFLSKEEKIADLKAAVRNRLKASFNGFITAIMGGS
jgi:hypothetical protein